MEIGQQEIAKKSKPEETNVMLKLQKLKVKLIAAAALVIAAALLCTGTWFAGRSSGNNKNEEEIAAKDAKIAELEKQLDDIKDNPIVVYPVAPKIELSVINAEIKELGELATAEYIYTNSVVFSDSKQIKNWNIPLTKKSFVIKWDGSIKAGIDVEQITTRVDEENLVLTIGLPQARILSHDPDTDSVEVLDEKDGLFNPVRLEDKIKLDSAVEKEMEKRASENGLLEDARKNAEALISELLYKNSDIKAYYTIEFETLSK